MSSLVTAVNVRLFFFRRAIPYLTGVLRHPFWFPIRFPLGVPTRAPSHRGRLLRGLRRRCFNGCPRNGQHAQSSRGLRRHEPSLWVRSSALF